MGAIAPSGLRTAHFSREFWGTCYPGKIFEMQSIAFCPLKFSKCLDSILNM